MGLYWRSGVPQCDSAVFRIGRPMTRRIYSREVKLTNGNFAGGARRQGYSVAARRHGGGQGGWSAAWPGDICRRTGHPDPRLRNGAARRGADIDGAHREHGAVAAASPDECEPADAMVAERSASDAESSDRRDERHIRSGPCCRRAVGATPVPASCLTPHLSDGICVNDASSTVIEPTVYRHCRPVCQPDIIPPL